jgi:ribosome-associated protein
MIPITATIAIGENEIEEEFVRSPGPGGQNVNKVATAVQLRFDVLHSPSLPEEIRQRMIGLAGRRLTAEGVLLINARRFRTQERNRQDARERLVELIRRAAEPPKVRRPTRPSRAARARRLEEKRRRGEQKSLRGPVLPEE